MTIERFKEVRPGKPLSAGEMNRAFRMIEGLTNITGYGGAQATYDPSSGLTISNDKYRQWGQITGKDGSTPPKYAWTLMQDLGDGTFADASPSLTGSATAGMWAQELSGNATVNNGTIVELLEANGQFWWFAIGSGGITVRNVSGSIIVTGVTTIQCDDATLIVQDMGNGAVKLSVKRTAKTVVDSINWNNCTNTTTTVQSCE